MASGFSISDRESDRINSAWILISQATQVSQTEKIFEVIKEISEKDFSDPTKRWHSDNEVQANLGLTNALETLHMECKSLENIVLPNTNLKKLDISAFIILNPFSWSNCSQEENPFFLRTSDLTEADLKFVNLRSSNLSGAILRYTDFKKADLTKANFSNTILDDATLYDVDARGANFSSANMQATIFMKATLSDANFSNSFLLGASLQKATATQCKFVNVDFSDSHLNEINAYQADFTNAIFDRTDLTEADFSEAIISSADFTNAIGLKPLQLKVACAKREKMPKLPSGIEPPSICE